MSGIGQRDSMTSEPPARFQYHVSRLSDNMIYIGPEESDTIARHLSRREAFVLPQEEHDNAVRLSNDPRRGSIMSFEAFVEQQIGIGTILSGDQVPHDVRQMSLHPLSVVRSRGAPFVPPSTVSLDGDTQRLANEVYEMLDDVNDTRASREALTENAYADVQTQLPTAVEVLLNESPPGSLEYASAEAETEREHQWAALPGTNATGSRAQGRKPLGTMHKFRRRSRPDPDSRAAKVLSSIANGTVKMLHLMKRAIPKSSSGQKQQPRRRQSRWSTYTGT